MPSSCPPPAPTASSPGLGLGIPNPSPPTDPSSLSSIRLPILLFIYCSRALFFLASSPLVVRLDWIAFYWIGLDWVGSAALGPSVSLLLFWQASCLMDGRSCGLGRVPAVTSDGTTSGHTTIPPEKHCAPDGTSRHAENADCSSEAGTCLDFSKSIIGLGVKKGLQKCATFPPSTGEAQQEDSDDSPNDAPTFERSVSLPPILKLISAMKGSRLKNGMASQTENRHVKWAPNVYDPPVTSVYHSVSYSYQRRSKSRKKDKNKQKQKHKGRSKKKQHNASQNSAVLQAPGLKDVGTSSGGSAPDDLGKHETEIHAY